MAHNTDVMLREREPVCIIFCYGGNQALGRPQEEPLKRGTRYPSPPWESDNLDLRVRLLPLLQQWLRTITWTRDLSLKMHLFKLVEILLGLFTSC